MRGAWPGITLALLSLSLAANLGRAQEAAPVPPWGENLEAEPARDRWRMLHVFDLTEEDEPGPTIWVRPEYVLAYIHSSRLPPLVTSGLTTDSRPGALGLPYTTISYGNESLDYQDRSGLRITVGGMVSPEHRLAIEASYLTLDGRTQGYQKSSPGNPIIARPFYDVINNQQDSSLTTYPGYFSGSINISNTSYLSTAELNAIAGIWDGAGCRVRGLVGLRQLRLRETLGISEASTITNAGFANLGETVFVNDSFETTNNFFGGQLGVAADYTWRRWTVELFGKAAIGALEERVTIDGRTTFLGTTTPGGLLALASNNGSYTNNRFAVVPEAGVKLQGAVGRHLLLQIGYSFLYLGDTVRPGTQVDLGVNPNLVPTSATFGGGGPVRPAFRFQESDYWAHLFSFGMTIQY